MYSVSNSWICRHFLFTSMVYGVTIHNCTYVVTVVMATKKQLLVAILYILFAFSHPVQCTPVCVLYSISMYCMYTCVEWVDWIELCLEAPSDSCH